MALAARNKISVTALDKGFERETKMAEKTTAAILEILKRKKVSIDVYLAPPALMKKLNAELRNKSYSADVLSFPEPFDFVEPESGHKKIGEIFLNVSEMPNMKKLFVHGLLHLLGYSHDKKKNWTVMEEKEEEILKKLKVRKVYNVHKVKPSNQ